ncbi:hypothetical protein BZG36_02710 [Bifiguratus adelaidae]|uniref:Mitochondrial import inner membrane translocase subunit TIM44 n=1 Tax=Bifiguratus adelaidae TaxID=1938954 RepID=A0A261Y1Q6_9FUNG|nr:hypothetical protein BZG36_02710 [Bifiguratus adelaidae]
MSVHRFAVAKVNLVSMPLRTLPRHIPSQSRIAGVRYNSNQSPVQAFINVFKDQIKKNKELQNNIKQLQEEGGKMSDSEALKRAKEMQEKLKASASVGSEHIRQASEAFQKTASKMGSTVSQAYKEAAETEFVKETSQKVMEAAENIHKASEPLRENPVTKQFSESVSKVLEDTSGRYGGYVDKETRRRLRDKARQQAGYTSAKDAVKNVTEDPEAGANLVVHKDAAWKESWRKFKEESPIIQGVFNARRRYEESENIFISYSRAFTDRIADAFTSMFEESDQAQAIKALQRLDPRFTLDSFMREAREYIVPELMDAYLKGDSETLKIWCSEATYNVLTAVVQAQMQQGLLSDCRILDLRDVDLVTAKILENDVPVLVLSFRTQEVIVFRNASTKEIVYGKEDNIEQVTYACVLTKQEDELQNPITGGWRVIDMAKHDSRPTW